MKWLYHIPHVWESPKERHVWEDIYLLPVDAPPDTESLWLTIDALGDPAVPEHGSERGEFRDESLVKLGDADWHIDATDMIVRAVDFDMDELLGWVRVWLAETGFECSELVPAPVERFSNTNDHATLVASLKAGMKPDKST